MTPNHSFSVLRFFADPTDIAAALSQLEAAVPVAYLPCGHFPTTELTAYPSARSIPGLGRTTSASSRSGPVFLIFDPRQGYQWRKIQRIDGSTVYAIDLLENPDCCALFTGGTFDDKAILAGEVQTRKSSEFGAKVLNELRRTMRPWKVAKSWRVGPSALTLARSGVRLTSSAGPSREFDIAVL